MNVYATAALIAAYLFPPLPAHGDEPASTTLAEVTVRPLDRPILYISGYMREYSTLRTLSDTIFLFREKAVDFMLPVGSKARHFRGWHIPRLLSSKSYYRFTGPEGLDSVSDHCNVHFSWSDWMELPAGMRLSGAVAGSGNVCDTVRGPRGRISQIWKRDDELVGVHVNVMADTLNTRWMKNIARRQSAGVDFEQMSLGCMYEDVDRDSISPDQIKDCIMHVRSMGRGYDLRLRGCRVQPEIETYAELYVTDKKYISVKEAKRLEKNLHEGVPADIAAPQRAPELPPEICSLVDKVDKIDRTRIRLNIVPDKRLAGIKDLFSTRPSAWQRIMSVISPPRYILNSSAMPSRH